MAAKFLVHMNALDTAAQSYLDVSYVTGDEIYDGFTPNTAAHSAAVNAVLHETSLVVTALSKFINQNVTEQISPMSTDTQVLTGLNERFTSFVASNTANNVSHALNIRTNPGSLNEETIQYDGHATEVIDIYFPADPADDRDLIMVTNSENEVEWQPLSQTNVGSSTIANHVSQYFTCKINGSIIDYNGSTNRTVGPFFAPTYAGSANEVLVSTGSGAPSWSNSLTGLQNVNAAYISCTGMYVAEQLSKSGANPSWSILSNGSINTIGKVTANSLDVTTTVDCASLTATGTIEATSFNSTSDMRLKKNIKDFESKGSILDLSVKEFDYKLSGFHSIGCIAQDLQKICPEIVVEGQDGYLSIEETKITYLLLNEMKKMKAEIDDLKKRLENVG